MKRLIAVGDAPECIALDGELLKLAKLDHGDEVEVRIRPNGVITLKPARRRRPSREEISKVVKSTMEKYSGALKKLA